MATRTKKEEGAGMAAEPRHIQSIPLGFRLVQAIEAAPGPLTLKDVAAAAGMDTGHAHLYLTSFRMVGLVQQNGSGGAYTLGPYALQMGLSALRRLDIVEGARPVLVDLQHATGLTAYLSVWGNHGPTIISKVDGLFAYPMTIRVGFALPVLGTATGRVFLSHLPEADTHELVEQEVRAAGAKGRALREGIERMVALVRSRGIAQSGSPINSGFCGMSSPVFDHEGKICAAVSVMGPEGAFDMRLTAAPAQAVREHAARLSRAIGHQPSI